MSFSSPNCSVSFVAPTKTVDANGDVVLRPARRCDLGTQPKEGEAK